MYCNRILDQKYKYPKEETYTNNVFSTWHLVESDITRHLILNPSNQLLYPKYQDTLKKKIYIYIYIYITIFNQIHEINAKYSLQQPDII